MELHGGKLTPFMLFYLENRDAVRARIMKPTKNINNNYYKQQQYRPEEISKEISRMWRSLDHERMKNYCLLSNLYAEGLAKHGPGRFTINHSSGSSSSYGNSGGGSGSGSGANGGRRKIGRTRRKKDSRLPKPSVSSFMWFSRHHRAILKSKKRDIGFCEVGKTIGQLWKSATEAEKRPFDDLAAQDKARYARELSDYKSWLVQSQRAKEREEKQAAAKRAKPPAPGTHVAADATEVTPVTARGTTAAATSAVSLGYASASVSNGSAMTPAVAATAGRDEITMPAESQRARLAAPTPTSTSTPTPTPTLLPALNESDAALNLDMTGERRLPTIQGSGVQPEQQQQRPSPKRYRRDEEQAPHLQALPVSPIPGEAANAAEPTSSESVLDVESGARSDVVSDVVPD